MKSVVLYSRPECHLCEQAMAEVLGLREEGLQFDLEEINIESDEALHRRYLERIPVVTVDGKLVSELILDVDALRARLDTVPA